MNQNEEKKSKPKLSYLSKADKRDLTFINALKKGSPLREYFEKNQELIHDVIRAGSIASSLDKNLFNNAFFLCELYEVKKREKDRINSEIKRRKEILNGLDSVERQYLIESIILGFSNVREQKFLRKKIATKLKSMSANKDAVNNLLANGIKIGTCLHFYSYDSNSVEKNKVHMPDIYQNNIFFNNLIKGMHQNGIYRLNNINELYTRIRHGCAFKYLGNKQGSIDQEQPKDEYFDLGI